MAKKNLYAQLEAPQFGVNAPADIEGDPMDVGAAYRGAMDIPSEPIGLNAGIPEANDPMDLEGLKAMLGAPTTPMGVPTGVVQGPQKSMTPQEQLLAMAGADRNKTPPPMTPAQQLMAYINSPDYQDQRKKILEASQGSVDEQQKGIKSNEDYLQKLQDQGPGINWAPLAALTDAWTGSDLAKASPKVDTQAAFQEKLAALKNQIQGQKQGLSTEQLNLLKDQLGGAASPMALLKNASTMNYQDRFGEGGSVDNLQEKNRVFQAQKAIVNNIQKNPNDAKQVQQFNNLNNAVVTLSSGTITPENFQEWQQAIRSNLGIKGTSGVGERAGTYLDGLGIQAPKLAEFLDTKPQDIRAKGGDYINHLQQMTNAEIGNIQSQRQKSLNKLSGGYWSLFEKPQYSAQKQDIMDLLNAAQAQTAGPALPSVTSMTNKQRISPKTKQIENIPGPTPPPVQRPHDMPVGAVLNGMVKTPQGWVAQ